MSLQSNISSLPKFANLRNDAFFLMYVPTSEVAFFAQIRRNRWNSAFPFYKYVHKYQVVITYRSIYQKIHTPSSLRLSSLPPAAPACAVVVAARFYLPWRICIFYDILNAHLEYFAGKLALWEKIRRTIFFVIDKK